MSRLLRALRCNSIIIEHHPAGTLAYRCWRLRWHLGKCWSPLIEYDEEESRG